MRHITTTFLLLAMSILNSCSKDWLDVKTNKNLVVPTTFKDCQGILDNNAVMNSWQCALGEVASDGFVCRPDYIQFLKDDEFNAYTWSKERPYIQVVDWASPDESTHRGPYRIIYYSNIVIDALMKIVPADQIDKSIYNDIMGQALYQRARCFYELAQVFAPHYAPGMNDSELGIPLRLNSDITVRTTRANLKENYSQLLNDLKTAAKLLPNLPKYKTRASKAAAFGMLSRVYLNLEDYQQSLLYSDSCLMIYKTLINFNAIAKNVAYPMTRFNDEVIFHSNLSLRNPNVFAIVSPDIYLKYGSSDLRKLAFFKQNSNGTISFKGNYSGNNLLFGGLTVSEIFLNRAESYARTGDIENAAKDLNALLRTRTDSNVAFIDITFADKTEALDTILNERRKEMFFRGSVRWSDLRRLNRDPRYSTTITREVNGKTFTLEPNSYKYTFPIPDDIIQQTGIPQNKGWE